MGSCRSETKIPAQWGQSAERGATPGGVSAVAGSTQKRSTKKKAGDAESAEPEDSAAAIRCEQRSGAFASSRTETRTDARACLRMLQGTDFSGDGKACGRDEEGRKGLPAD